MAFRFDPDPAARFRLAWRGLDRTAQGEFMSIILAAGGGSREVPALPASKRHLTPIVEAWFALSIDERTAVTLEIQRELEKT